MATVYLKSGSGVTERANSTVYAVGARMVKALGDTATNYEVAKKWVWECTGITGTGTSGADTTTLWPATVAAGQTITDGEVTWTARVPGFNSSAADWTFATPFLVYALPAAEAGGLIYVSNNHAEASATAAIRLDSPGTAAAPVRILCVDDSAAPPTTLATTASVATTGSYNIHPTGHAYVYGVTISTKSEFYPWSSPAGVHQWHLERCKLEITATAGTRILLSNSSSLLKLVLKDTDVQFNHAGQRFVLRDGSLEWHGGKLLGVAPTNLLVMDTVGGSRGIAHVESADLSIMGSGKSLCDITPAGGPMHALFHNCRLGVDVGIAPGTSGLVNSDVRVENCDAIGKKRRIAHVRRFGTVDDDESNVRSGGANDGAPFAWKMVATNDAGSFPLGQLESPEISKWNRTANKSLTASVEVLHTDADNLTNAELWLDVLYLGDGSTRTGTLVSTRHTNPLTTGTALTANGSGTWTDENSKMKSKLSVTIKPRQAGWIIARVRLAKASAVVYVDPKLTIEAA